MSGMQLFGVITVASTAGILVVCFILYAILQRKRHLRCPKCGARFKASAAATFFAARNGVDKRLTCPECHYFGYMEDCRDSEAAPDEPAMHEAGEQLPDPSVDKSSDSTRPDA